MYLNFVIAAEGTKYHSLLDTIHLSLFIITLSYLTIFQEILYFRKEVKMLPVRILTSVKMIQYLYIIRNISSVDSYKLALT